MYRSLSDLRDSVNRLIEQQGEDAPCAAFIFTKEDVSDCTEFLDDPISSENMGDFVDAVLTDVGDSDYIYDKINEVLDDSVKEQSPRF